MKYKASVIFLCIVSTVVVAVGQTASARPGNASSFLSQVAHVFSPQKPVSHVQLTGSATWYAGSLEDTGDATLTASSNGAAEMSLYLAKKGSWKESQTKIGADMTCSWQTDSSVQHEGDAMNCMRSSVWFLPLITLQPSLIPSAVGISDLGVGKVGDNNGSYRHLQSQAVFGKMSNDLLASSMEASTMDIGIEPNTLLPSVLHYHLRPDNGVQGKIAIEIRYSHYREVDGVKIPFLIQRYMNGSLQLEIHVNAAQIS